MPADGLGLVIKLTYFADLLWAYFGLDSFLNGVTLNQTDPWHYEN